DLKKFVESSSLVDDRTMELGMRPGPEGTLRPEEALDFIFGWTEGERPSITVHKIQVRFKESDPCPTKS
ncbi:MAG: hypothetical protein ABSF48_09675, partial [Thermodesulfobacteriota bacterium]